MFRALCQVDAPRLRFGLSAFRRRHEKSEAACVCGVLPSPCANKRPVSRDRLALCDGMLFAYRLGNRNGAALGSMRSSHSPTATTGSTSRHRMLKDKDRDHVQVIFSKIIWSGRCRPDGSRAHGERRECADRHKIFARFQIRRPVRAVRRRDRQGLLQGRRASTSPSTPPPVRSSRSPASRPAPTTWASPTSTR